MRALANNPERVRELASCARAAAPRYDRERNALAMLDTLVRLAPEGTSQVLVRERVAE